MNAGSSDYQDDLARSPQTWVEGVAQTVAEEIEGQHRDQNGEPGEEPEPRRVTQVLLARLEHDAPVGVGRLRAKPNEAKSRGIDDGLPDRERGQDDDRRPRVSQDVADDDLGVRLTHSPRGLDILLLLDGEDRAAHDAGERGDVDDGHSDDDVLDSWTEYGHDANRQQEPGKREKDVDESHDDLIDHAAKVARDQAQAHADNQGDQYGDDPDRECHPRTDQNPAQHISPELVRTEQMLGTRW